MANSRYLRNLQQICFARSHTFNQREYVDVGSGWICVCVFVFVRKHSCLLQVRIIPGFHPIEPDFSPYHIGTRCSWQVVYLRVNEPGDAWSLTAGDDGNDATGTADHMIGVGRQQAKIVDVWNTMKQLFIWLTDLMHAVVQPCKLLQSKTGECSAGLGPAARTHA